jgi:hypothetical protein
MPAVDDPGVTSTATLVAVGYCASIAACTEATSAGVIVFANVIWDVTACGVDATAGDAEVACPRLGWLAKIELRSAAGAPLMAV